MHRFHLPPNEWQTSPLTLRGGEAHHAHHVLRLGVGDKLVVFDGRGREATAEIASITGSDLQLRVLHEARTAPLRCRITLGQAIPKGKNMELIVQKAVEIGAAEIAPLISERTIVRLSAREAEEKREKWQQIAVEAAKQCGQNWLPEVRAPQNVADFFATPVAAVYDRRPAATSPDDGGHRPPLQAFDLRLIGSLQPDAQHLKKILAAYEAEHHARPANVLILIGPEGDFTPAELNLARTHGCQPITLGPIILRVETAAIYCLSVLSYELLV